MPSRLRHYSLVLLVGGAALGPWHRPGPPKDLDTLSATQLNTALEAELDDIYEGRAPDAPVSIAMIEAEILDALGDDGDDALESTIDLEDLEAEMAEAETTVEAVVAAALAAIDDASGPAPRTSPFRFATFTAAPPEGLRTTRRLAVRQTKKEIVAAIQAVRR